MEGTAQVCCDSGRQKLIQNDLTSLYFSAVLFVSLLLSYFFKNKLCSRFLLQLGSAGCINHRFVHPVLHSIYPT